MYVSQTLWRSHTEVKGDSASSDFQLNFDPSNEVLAHLVQARACNPH